MKQLIKQPFFWFLFYFVALLLPPTLFSREFRKISQNLSSYDYDENPPVKVIFVNHAHNSNKLSLSIDMRPVDPTFTYSEQWSAAPDWSNTSAEGFQEYFQDTKPAKILNKYELYSLAEFRAFLKTLLGYKKHIQKKHTELVKRSRFTHFWAKLWSAARDTTSPSHMQNFIKKMYDELVQKEEQINQLQRLYHAYKDCPPLSVKHSQLVSQRMHASQQSLNKNLQHSSDKNNWFDVDPIFIDSFNLDRSTFGLTGTPVQHFLQEEFHDIAQETAQAWIYHKNNSYVEQLVKKNVTCIKNGIAQNQSGNVAKAAHLADIGWAILDHIQALGEGVFQGAENVALAFLHPIETVQGTAKGVAQCTYYLGQATLEAIDLSILAVTDQNAACKKLQTWKQNFTKLANTVNEQWQITSNRDITKFISRFAAEILVTHQAFRALHELFSVVRTNTTKLVQKTQKVTKSIPQATAATKTAKESVTVNEVVTHKQPIFKQIKKSTKKLAGEISNTELIRRFNIAEYNPSIGDLKKLEIAVKKLKDIKGALGTNGPLRNALRFGKKSCEPGELNTARGAIYELEKALELIEQNEFPLEFGKHLKFESTSREFDIITNKRLIECKNRNWSKMTVQELENTKAKFGMQIKVAKVLNKIFEVHSKNSLPDILKQFFRENGISFIEG